VDPSLQPPAKTIDDVIARLDGIIETCTREKSRLAFFPVLYRVVTIRVKEGITAGRFQDGARMERLDVIFANRYIDAFEQHRGSITPTKSWLVAFEQAKRWRLLILQHLLLGINAHINLDLGIAAALTAPGANLSALKADFDEINRILNELMLIVQPKIGALSPLIGWLDRVGGRTDTTFLDFSMIVARDGAWRFAEELTAMPPDQMPACIVERDERVAALPNKVIVKPGWLLRLVSLIVRLFETSDIEKVVRLLS
jgi:hypothetical protein